MDIVIEPDEIEIVKLIFQKYVYEGYGARRICRYFQAQDIRRKNGTDITPGIVHRVLKNPIYIGIIHCGDSKSEVLPDLRIIDEELFAKAQEIIQERSVRR